MYWQIEAPGIKVDIVDKKSFCQGDSFQQFSNQDEAARFLEGFSIDWKNFDRMLTAIRESGETAKTGSHKEVAAQLARLVFADRLRLRRSEHPSERQFRGPFGMKLGTWGERNPVQVQKASATAPTAPANDWIKVKVVDDESGEVIPKVKLVLKTPDNSTEEHETRLSGLIESLGLQSGNCEVCSDLKDATLETTLTFIGVGESPIGQNKSSNSNSGQVSNPPPGSRLYIATVDEYKVKSGDTPKSIADSVGMTWQELSKFNWGTDKPNEVNKYLEEDVGCTKKTADGKDFIFDDSDEPGIIYLPKKWTKDGLATNQQHVIRVRLRAAKTPVEIRLYDDEMVPYANKKYSLALDGKTYKGRLTDDGELIRKLHEDAKSGTVTLWPYEDDDEVTIDIPIQFESKPLKPETDDEGAIVRLVGLGYSLGTDDSASSPKAVMAISRFQTDYDLPSTGELDDDTRSKLKEVYGC